VSPVTAIVSVRGHGADVLTADVLGGAVLTGAVLTGDVPAGEVLTVAWSAGPGAIVEEASVASASVEASAVTETTTDCVVAGGPAASAVHAAATIRSSSGIARMTIATASRTVACGGGGVR
jgi:hypothetical protein